MKAVLQGGVSARIVVRANHGRLYGIRPAVIPHKLYHTAIAAQNTLPHLFVRRTLLGRVPSVLNAQLPIVSNETLLAKSAYSTVMESSLEPILQDQREVNDMVLGLYKGVKAGKKAAPYTCKKVTFELGEKGNEMQVFSWKFNDWDYKTGQLPTYARGLFTYRDPVTNNHEIVVRGYDKFFNMGEVKRTAWNWIRENTKAPYELSLKENGCIIFISGLKDGKLLVCSKHSTGSVKDAESHAQVGERWIDKHLASVGKTRAELSKHLRDLNATAVAELCDDSFEEHILPYTDEKSGLYLHGINFNVPKFTTYSSKDVQNFAEMYGMRKTDFFESQDVDSLKKFLETSAETGTWDGRDVEGFVIRCKARDGPDQPWHDWFWKYKFEEPYLMYRQWREVTKTMLSGKAPKIRKHKEVTKDYLEFAKSYFEKKPELVKQYQANHGIIELRNVFLEHKGVKGAELVKLDLEAEPKDTGEEKLVLVPVGTIGCGKTTVALALSKLLGWGHIQNDSLSSPNKPQKFARGVDEKLARHNAVIADRNNHLRRERQQIIDDIENVRPSVQFVALNYVHSKPDVSPEDYLQRIRKVTEDRVFRRGDNHQTIQAASTSSQEVTEIMKGFLERFEPLDSSEGPDTSFHTVIDLDIEADSRTNLESVLRRLHKEFPAIVTEVPSPEKLDEAIEYAIKEYQPLNGTPVLKKGLDMRTVEYFSLRVPQKSVIDVLESKLETVPAEEKAFYEELKSKKRVHSTLHVTLFHREHLKDSQGKQIPERQSLLDMYGNMLSSPNQPIKCVIKLRKAVWDGKCMAIVVELVPVDTTTLPCVPEVPHITIGTKSSDIKPKESNDMLKVWKTGSDKEKIHEIDLGGVELEGTLNVCGGDPPGPHFGPMRLRRNKRRR